MTPRALNSLSELVDLYDDFLIDQFGVLRDGKGAYPGAPEALKKLKAKDKRIIILSNSGKRAAENDRRLAKIGFDRESWNMFLTSGEVAFHLIQSGKIGPKGASKVLLISRDGDQSAIDGLGFTVVHTSDAADVILITASEGDRYPLEHYSAMLAAGAKRNLPCLCTNPDMIMLTADGTAYGAGVIAELYEELGGKVTYIGKPHPDMYSTALSLLGDVRKSRTVCIGDSIEHDIAGAKAAGLASVLVTTGILEHMSDAERNALYVEHNATPDYILPHFVWQKG